MSYPSRMAAKIKLELLSGLRHHRDPTSSVANGFTLIELMVVVFVFSLIAAVAIPTLLRARNRSEAGAVVGELTGLAKECAMANASKLQEVVSLNGVSVTCNGSPVTITGRPFLVPADGVVCLGVTAGPTVSGVYVTVSPAGRMSCSFV